MQAVVQGDRPVGAVGEVARALGERIKGSRQVVERARKHVKLVQAIAQRRILTPARQVDAGAHRLFEGGAQVGHRRLQQLQAARRAGAGGQRVTGQLSDLPGADPAREEAHRRVRHLMRFVDDHRVGAGQHLAEAGLLERHVGKQQVMVDHHDVRLLGLPPRVDQVTVGQERTLAAETVVLR